MYKSSKPVPVTASLALKCMFSDATHGDEVLAVDRHRYRHRRQHHHELAIGWDAPEAIRLMIRAHHTFWLAAYGLRRPEACERLRHGL